MLDADRLRHLIESPALVEAASSGGAGAGQKDLLLPGRLCELSGQPAVAGRASMSVIARAGLDPRKQLRLERATIRFFICQSYTRWARVKPARQVEQHIRRKATRLDTCATPWKSVPQTGPTRGYFGIVPTAMLVGLPSTISVASRSRIRAKTQSNQ